MKFGLLSTRPLSERSLLRTLDPLLARRHRRSVPDLDKTHRAEPLVGQDNAVAAAGHAIEVGHRAVRRKCQVLAVKRDLSSSVTIKTKKNGRTYNRQLLSARSLGLTRVQE